MRCPASARADTTSHSTTVSTLPLERHRRAGRPHRNRRGVAAGLAAGWAGTFRTVNALGTPGLSGAGITSGLAALGAVFGGRMKTRTL